MRCGRVAKAVGILAAASMATSGCRQSQVKIPEDQRVSAERPLNQPVTVTGCLRAGLAENTFVLNAAKTEGDAETATYQLAAAPDINLGQHAGQEVEVSGTLRAEQTVASSGTVEEKPAKGTVGKPVVETKSELNVRKLDVASIKPTGNSCGEK